MGKIFATMLLPASSALIYLVIFQTPRKYLFFPIFGGDFPISSWKKVLRIIIVLSSKSLLKIVCTACSHSVLIREN